VKDKIFSQADIHRFCFKTSVIVLAFLITSVLSELLSLASTESQFNESKNIAQAQVTYYESLDKIAPEDQINLVIAQATLDSANQSINMNKSIVKLNKVITHICMYLSPIFFLIGLFFWVKYLPYVKVPNIKKTDQ